MLNVSTITTLINGKLFIGEKPIARDLEDIVIGVLLSKPEFNGELQVGTVNINCFTKAINNHTRNAARLNEITDAVITVLNLTYNNGNSGALHYQLESQKTFRDYDDPSMFYSNIKLKFSHKNN